MLNNKPMLNLDEQIAHLISKGVKFEIIKPEDARKYLRENNNYFKLCAYRKNINKFQRGDLKDKYINLDFAMLKDLAVIDMRLRRILIVMALDIEHFARVRLLHAIEESDNDGYQIVSDYLSLLQNEDKIKNTNRYSSLMSELQRNRNNPYCGGIVKKYDSSYPVWAFVEIISFGSLIHFYKFCSEQLMLSKEKDDYYLLLSVREIRNAAAHNNCILHDMGAKDALHNVNYCVNNALSSISKGMRRRNFSNERMRQIITLFYTHTVFVTSTGIINYTARELDTFVSRAYNHIDYYVENPSILSSFSFLKKSIDILYP